MLYFLPQQEIERRVNSREIRIGLIGLGRVGLPLAATLADEGFEVLGVDIKNEAVAKINVGESPITDEMGLKELLQKVIARKALKATTQIAAIKECDLIIIAAPTLIKEKEPDIDAVKIAADKLAQNFSRGKVVVLESTVPPFTTQNVLGKAIEERTRLKPGRDFGLAYSPERTAAPQVLRDLKSYPKIVGGIDEKSIFIVSMVYSTFAPSIIKMSSLVAAEIEKVIENTHRDVNIAFANELARICEIYSIDVYKIIKAANSQPYSHILNPGLVGGHCIPMDPYYIISDARKRGLTPKLMQTAREINESVFQDVVNMIDGDIKRIPVHPSVILKERSDRRISETLRSAQGDTSETEYSPRKITILGLSFKEDVKSFEASHTLKLVHLLAEKGYDVTVHDPFLGNCQLSTDLYHAIEGSDCVILSTAHSVYNQIDFDKVKEIMRGDLIVDLRGMFDPKKVLYSGLRYKGLGRGEGLG